ncbi:MAG TPA: Rne/Rng family ribonuclease [Actinomycetaceae bacterium]|nr:Rne/Rng family ribonuclease [Actinomycetaceae bacterium]
MAEETTTTQGPEQANNEKTAPLFSASGSAGTGDHPETDAPRLAAAALLFQAPALTATDRSESGQADSGQSEQKESNNSRRRRGSRGRRRTSDDSAQGESGSKQSEQTGEPKAAPEGSEDSPPETKNGAPRTASGESARSSGNGSDDSDDTGGDSGRSEAAASSSSSSRRRRRRSRSASSREASPRSSDSQVSSVVGSTRLEAKRQRRKEGREAGRRRQTITESEFLARRESVDRQMLVREQEGLNQIAVLEDGVLVEHYVARRTQSSMVGNVYLGRVQNVLPSMEAAFVDLGKGRNAVLYAGEVNWDAAGTEGKPRRIEDALKSGDQVLVQVTKDPIGHKGARLTSQITLAGRHLVLVPSGSMTGISRKLPENERARLKKLLKEMVPEGSGVIVRTAAEGASEEQLRDDVARLVRIWEGIEKKSGSARSAPVLLKGEPELAVRVVRDVFNEDFTKLVVSGREAHAKIKDYVDELAPDLADRVEQWTANEDLFSACRVDEQLAKGMDRKVWLPSGGSIVIDRTEAMTVIDVNTGRFTGSGGSLEETVTKNNLEAAEEIVRQLRLRDIGGIIVIDFIDMILESNRDLVLRRLVECLGRDRTRHQVAEVTSLGLVQMTRKRVGQGLVEAFSDPCTHCGGRGFVVHDHPVEKSGADGGSASGSSSRRSSGRRGSTGSGGGAPSTPTPEPVDEAKSQAMRATMKTIAAAAAHAHESDGEDDAESGDAGRGVGGTEPGSSAGDDAASSTGHDVKAASGRDDAGTASPVRSPRAGRRRVVAAGQHVESESDSKPAIISLPAPQQHAADGNPPLSPSLLDSLVFPEREEARAPRKAARRATASGGRVESAPEAVESPEGDAVVVEEAEAQNDTETNETATEEPEEKTGGPGGSE